MNRSQPYILILENTSIVNASNVPVGNAFAVNPSNPRITINTNGSVDVAQPPMLSPVWSVNISIDSSTTTYIEFLNRMKITPMKVGRIMVVSVDGNNNQIETTYTIVHRNANNRSDNALHPTIDPNQEQSDRVVDSTWFLFDGATTITVYSIPAGSKVKIYIYPQVEFYSTQIAANRNPIGRYSQPSIGSSDYDVVVRSPWGRDW